VKRAGRPRVARLQVGVSRGRSSACRAKSFAGGFGNPLRVPNLLSSRTAAVHCLSSVDGDVPGPYPGEDRSSRSRGSNQLRKPATGFRAFPR
jgi:hypothetical protein